MAFLQMISVILNSYSLSEAVSSELEEADDPRLGIADGFRQYHVSGYQPNRHLVCIFLYRLRLGRNWMTSTRTTLHE